MPDKSCRVIELGLGVALIASVLTWSKTTPELRTKAVQFVADSVEGPREAMCSKYIEQRCNERTDKALAEHAANHNATSQQMLEKILARFDKSDEANARAINASKDVIVETVLNVNETIHQKLTNLTQQIEELGARIKSIPVLVTMPFVSSLAGGNVVLNYAIWIPFWISYFHGGMDPLAVITLCVGIAFAGRAFCGVDLPEWIKSCSDAARALCCPTTTNAPAAAVAPATAAQASAPASASASAFQRAPARVSQPPPYHPDGDDSDLSN